MRTPLHLALVAVIAIAGCSKKSTPTSPTTTTPTCTYNISTTTFSMAGTGGSATFTVNTASTCAWTVTSNASFVSITTPASQTGTGSVSFTVPANTGDTRSGTLTIAGQAVTITQSSNDQVYGNWGGTITKGSGCNAALPASAEWTGVIQRTSGSTNELVITIPGIVSNLAINLIINGSTLQFAVPIDTLYTFNATLSSDRRSLTGTFSGGSCSGNWSGARR